LSEKNRKDVHNSEIPILCLACEARHKGICGALDPDQLVRLSKQTTKHLYAREKELISAGDGPQRYSNVMGGIVKLTKLMADGRQQIVGLQFAPDFLGRPFTEQSSISAEAATEVRLCSFPKSTLEEIMRESPEMEHRLHSQTLKELDEARDWMLTLGRKSAHEKVASFLYLIATHIDPERDVEDNSITIELPLKRADIADFLGLTIETVSRQLTNIRKTGIIEIKNNRQVTIPNLAKLRNLTEQDLTS
jgi:CRP/FNR family transcriptional regulator